MAIPQYDRYICTYKLGNSTDKYDTISSREGFGQFTHISHNDQFVIFTKGEQVVYQALSELKSGHNDNYQIIPGVPEEIFDFDESSGIFVYTKNYDFYLGNFKKNLGAQKILQGSTTKKD
jgi:hypothetical protein